MGLITRRTVLAAMSSFPVAAFAANTAKPYVKTEMAYGNQSNLQRLDLYTPVQETGPFPVVMWIHGGGFYNGDKSAMPQVDRHPVPTRPNERPYQIQVPDVDALTRMGYAVVSLNYRLGGSANRYEPIPNAIRDGKSSIRYLRANAEMLRIDPTRIAVWGNSAGGYMASMIGITGDQPSPFDGPDNADFSSAAQAAIVWYGAETRGVPNELQNATYIATARKLPPFLIACGELDTITPVAESRLLHDALVRHGASATLTVVKGAGHEDPLFMKTQMQPTFDFLERSLAR